MNAIGAELLELIEARLFNFAGSVAGHDWQMIASAKDIDGYLYSQSAQTVWLDLREMNSYIIALASQEEKSWWDSQMMPLIYARLEEKGYGDYTNDVEADLLNVYLNLTHQRQNPLWDAVLLAYQQGMFPCGWAGKYPAGRMVVFCPAAA